MTYTCLQSQLTSWDAVEAIVTAKHRERAEEAARRRLEVETKYDEELRQAAEEQRQLHEHQQQWHVRTPSGLTVPGKRELPP